jgi:hypothetical protein
MTESIQIASWIVVFLLIVIAASVLAVIPELNQIRAAIESLREELRAQGK